VDVLAAIKDGKDNIYSKTVLHKVKVIAIAQETSSDSSKPKVVNAVTLELTPKESEILDVARSAGTLTLTLRNPTDSELPEPSMTQFFDVFDSRKTFVNAGSPAKQKNNNSTKKFYPLSSEPVTLIKGTNASEVKF
jgi:pilus assembly protein CpaB